MEKSKGNIFLSVFSYICTPRLLLGSLRAGLAVAPSAERPT